MSDARETVEKIIDRLLDEMEIETKTEMEQQVNYDRMQFNWKMVKSAYTG
jgi:hypothetical protein